MRIERDLINSIPTTVVLDTWLEEMCLDKLEGYEDVR
jgi:hypothetical protein